MQGGVTYIVLFLSYVVLTRILTPVEIGKLPLLNATVAVFGTVSGLSLQIAVTKFVSEYAGGGGSDRTWGIVWTAIKVVSAVSIPAFMLLGVFSQQLSEFIFGSTGDAGLVMLVLLAALVSNFGALLVSVLWGLNLFSRMVTCNLAGVIMGRVFGLLLAWIGLRLPGFIIGWVIGSTTVLALSIVYARPHLKKPSPDVAARMLVAYSYPIFFANLIALVQSWADVTILYALTRSLAYAGIYYLGLAGAGILSPIAGALTSALFPTLSARFGAMMPNDAQ
jgi:O-antigen/teichoic acid export membrane protein